MNSKLNLCTLTLQILGADFCMSPTSNAISVAPIDTQEIITYYSNCQGTNPLEVPLMEAYNYTKLLNSTIHELVNSDACKDDQDLIACYSDINSIFSSLEVVTAAAQCPPVKEQWDNVVNEATCDSMFYGLLELWAGQYWTALMLFFLLISGTICYSYFDVWFEDEDTSPFNTGNEMSSKDSQRAKSINLGSTSSRSTLNADARQGQNAAAAAAGGEEAMRDAHGVTYSTTFLYDESPRQQDEDGDSALKFVF